jgi:Ca2+-dependent lipid-binding protein
MCKCGAASKKKRKGFLSSRFTSLFISMSGAGVHKKPHATDGTTVLARGLSILGLKDLDEVGTTVLAAFLAYVSGYYQRSLLYLGVLAMLMVYGWHRQECRVKAKRHLHVARMAHDFKKLQMVLPEGEVPHWVRLFPAEGTKWLNSLLRLLWPYVKQAAEESMKTAMDSNLDFYRPSFLTKLEAKRCDLGNNPLRFNGFVVDDSFDDQVLLDIDMEFRTDSDIRVIAEATQVLQVETIIKDLLLAGKLRVSMKPLLDNASCIGAISVGFSGKPAVDYDLQAAKLNIDYIPGLGSWLHKFLKDTLAYYMVWPRKIVVPMIDMPEDQLNDLWASYPMGMLTIQAVDVTLPRKKKKSYYVRMQLAGENKAVETKTIKVEATDGLCWSPSITFPVSDPTVQVLSLNLYADDDKVGESTFSCAVLADHVKSSYSEQHRLAFQYGTGQFNVDVLWQPFDRGADDEKDLSALVVVVHGGENLKIADVTSSDPYVTMRLGPKDESKEHDKTPAAKGDGVYVTSTIMKCLNPVWEEQFTLNISDTEDPSQRWLYLDIWDYDRFSDHDFLGLIRIDLSELKPNQRYVKKYELVGVDTGVLDVSFMYLPYV